MISDSRTAEPRRLDLDDGGWIAYHRRAAEAAGAARPGLVFLGGFMSDMTGTKATALEGYAAVRGRAFLRLDYRGHGASSGRFEEGTIGSWAADATAAFDSLTEGPQVLIGSSMGGWIALILALARPERVAALVGLAAAPDFTERMWRKELSAAQRQAIESAGHCELASDYGDQPYIITRALIEDGRRQCLLGGPIAIPCPVRLIQGMADTAVPWQTAPAILERLESPDAEALLLKNGDHRLSTPAELARLFAVLDAL